MIDDDVVFVGYLPIDRTWEVRGFYNADVAPPKKPLGLALHTWARADHAKDMEADIMLRRADLGVVEVRRINNGQPDGWQQVTLDGKKG